MIGSYGASKAYSEGVKAKKDGLESFDNPYSFVTETPAAYAWDDGFKKGK